MSSETVLLLGISFELEALFNVQGKMRTCQSGHESSNGETRCSYCKGTVKEVPKLIPLFHWRDQSPVLFRKGAMDVARQIQYRAYADNRPLTLDYWGDRYLIGKRLVSMECGIEKVNLSTIDRIKTEVTVLFRTLQLPASDLGLYLITRV